MALASPMPSPEPEEPKSSARIERSEMAHRVRPRLRVVEEAELGRAPGRSRRSYVLFGLLGLSVLFFASVQVYVSRLEAQRADASLVADLTGMTVTSPSRPVYPRELRLSWEPVDGAVAYRLRVRTANGAPVVDPLETFGTAWYAPNQVIPGLVPGPYVWTVEAIDSAGIGLARSGEHTFEIRGSSVAPGSSRSR